ncbi:hypothetical protein C5S35_05735 [Candidatus Methanophagaceae archaeon]|nr:hypothetical protein C5S35_05735 [Methanophagales archaeon]
MKTEAISMKYRKAEEHAALMVRSCKPGIAYCFEKCDVNHNIDVHFCASCEKTESKFMNTNEICKISYL